MRTPLALLLAVMTVLPSHALSNETTTRQLARFMSEAEKEGFRGAVLVAQGGKIILEHGYGVADPTKNRPVKADTVFSTGSITKQFTAAAILVLEQEGKLSVDDPITDYFTDVPQDKQGIVLHHLLTHTAGFDQAIGGDREKIGRDDFIRRALESALLFEPGSKYEYSNVGYSLLAAIVEKTSGEGYESFLRKRLFEPAGMKDTGYTLPKWDSTRLAHGFKDDGSDWGTMVDNVLGGGGPGWNLVGNGGIQSTVGDMFRWHEALSGEAILTAESRTKLYGRHADEGGSWYGYGWSIEDTPHGTLLTHNGGNPYFFSDFLRYPETDTVIYYSTSSRERRMQELARPLAQIVFTGEVPDFPESRKALGPLNEGPPAVAGSAAARWGFPGSFGSNRAAELLDAIVTHDDPLRRTFVSGGFTPASLERNGKDKLFNALQMLQGEFGEFSANGVRTTNESEVTIVIESKSHPDRLLLVIGLEAEEPNRIETIRLEVGD